MGSQADEYLERWEQHRNHRRYWEPVWQELAEFIQPRKSNITYTRTPGRQQTERLFDSTAIHANEMLAASMQGALTSSATRWFSLRIRGVELDKDHAVALLLEQCASEMYDTIRQSNHAAEIHELYQDISCFGIGGVFVEDKDPSPGTLHGGIRHTALHPGEYCIEENAEGYVDTVYREFELSARAAVKRWKNNVGSKVEAALENDATQKFKFLQVVFPSDDPRPLNPKKEPYTFLSVYIDIASKKLMEQGGYYEFPFMVPRWSKTSGEVYGRGPGFTALPDIKTLNKAVELKLRALALAIQPPIKSRDEGVIGTVKLQPAGVTHVRDMDAVEVLDLGGRFDVAEIEEDKLRGAIRRIFYSDQLQLQEGPQMTAYEVQVRYELMQRILGPTLGRLEVELLNPYIERVFFSTLRHSKPDSPFRAVAEWCRQNGFQLDIEYEGPLARAQRLQESVAVQRFFNIVLPLSAANPDVLDLVNLDETVRLHAISTGVPMRILNTPEQVQALRDGRKQAREQQSEVETMDKMAGAAGKAAPILEALNAAQAQGILPASGAVQGAPQMVTAGA